MNKIWRSRLGIIIPLALFVVFFGVYSIIWRGAAQTVQEEIALFAMREAEAGRTFTYTDITVEGYPLMLRGTVKNAVWDASGLGAFAAEELVLAAVPTQPDRVVLSPRGRKTLTIGETTYDLEADDLRFNLQRSFLAAEGHNITLTNETADITIRDVIANREAVSGGQSVSISIKDVLIDGNLPTAIPYFDLYGSRTERGLTIAGVLLGIGKADASDPTQFAGKGDLSVGEDGLVDGSFDLAILNEGPAIELLGAMGALDEGVVDTVKMGIGMMTSSGTEEVTLPLRIEDSEVTLGFIPLGTLPNIDQ